MQMLPGPDRLGEKRYVTLVVRLLVDQQDHLILGEVVNVERSGLGQFKVWRDMLGVIRSLLAAPPKESLPEN